MWNWRGGIDARYGGRMWNWRGGIDARHGGRMWRERGNGPHPRPVGHPLSINGEGVYARVAGVMELARG